MCDHTCCPEAYAPGESSSQEAQIAALRADIEGIAAKVADLSREMAELRAAREDIMSRAFHDALNDTGTIR